MSFIELPINLDLYLSFVQQSKESFKLNLQKRLDRNGIKSPWIDQIVTNCELLAEKGIFNKLEN